MACAPGNQLHSYRLWYSVECIWLKIDECRVSCIEITGYKRANYDFNHFGLSSFIVLKYFNDWTLQIFCYINCIILKTPYSISGFLSIFWIKQQCPWVLSFVHLDWNGPTTSIYSNMNPWKPCKFINKGIAQIYEICKNISKKISVYTVVPCVFRSLSIH